MPLHSILVRQLRRLGLDAESPPGPEQWRELLERVSRTYGDADQDRYTLERSIEVSGAEMRELYVHLSREHETLLASRERVRAIFDHSAIGQGLVDANGRFSETNGALSRMLGFEGGELVGHELLDFVAPEVRAEFAGPFAELLAGERQLLGVEHQWRTKAGAPRWVDVACSLVQATAPRSAAVIVQDIQDRKQLEVELRHAQKLESVGRLAAGVAHEINTPVQFVSDNVPFLQEAVQAYRALRTRLRDLLAQAVADGSVSEVEVTRAEAELEIEFYEAEVPRAFEQTLEGIQRVGTIVRAMREFAHPDRGELTLADLNRALLSTITVARGELKSVADVHTELGDIPQVRCYLGDLNQAFLNILINAAHAIGEVVARGGGRGVIRVSTSRDGDHVLVRIADTGAGIAEEHRERVFDPFFTTKPVGRGTGQGLALARAVVVERHKGQLSFTTRLGEGTTFEIRLPV